MFEGQTYPLDVLIYATGFEVQKTGIYNEIRGENGLELNETYARRHAHAVRGSTPRAIRTCSSWAATRPRSSST